MNTTQQIQGESLRDRLKREHRLPLNLAVRLAREAAEALVEQHAGGTVHGGVCLDNLWLDSSGTLHLVGTVPPASEEHSFLERLGTVSRTRLIAPEQATGETVTPAADLFGLGCVLYQMLTGEPPFHGDSLSSLTRSIVFADPKPARDLNPDVPEPLNNLASQLLAKMPEGRPASAAAVVDRLTQWYLPAVSTSERFSPPPTLYSASKRVLETIGVDRLPEMPPPEPLPKAVVIIAPPLPERKRRWWVDVVVAVFLIAVAAGLYFWWR
jgi:serine/threonine protein kinase